MARHTFTLAILALLAPVWITPVRAQEPGDCARVHTVQEGDWLSKLARQYLDDPAAYPAIDLEKLLSLDPDPNTPWLRSKNT